MKAVEITDETLASYTRRTRKDTWVLTRRGKPVAAVVPISSGVDLETFGLSHNPNFIEILNRSWASYERKGGVSLEEMRRRHVPVAKKSARKRPAR
jgi:antitoxin (DNA-binding transcriptional repressor) of toxin-antitoxin stability system